MPLVLEMKNIHKSFENTQVLNDVSLSVRKGTITAIIGSSGSGKTTLLRCATMLETIDKGEIRYMDDLLVSTPDGDVPKYCGNEMKKKIRSHFGLVFQSFNLFPHFSVLRNIIEAPVRVTGQPLADARGHAFELLEKLGLSDKADYYPYQLSGGQQQRISIARALALNPDILFFDEPTSALDPELTGEVLKIIQTLAEEHMTMVIVTHEIGFARAVADHIVFMDKGVIVEEGEPDEIIGNPKSPRTQAFLSKLIKN